VAPLSPLIRSPATKFVPPDGLSLLLAPGSSTAQGVRSGLSIRRWFSALTSPLNNSVQKPGSFAKSVAKLASMPNLLPAFLFCQMWKGCSCLLRVWFKTAACVVALADQVNCPPVPCPAHQVRESLTRYWLLLWTRSELGATFCTLGPTMRTWIRPPTL